MNKSKFTKAVIIIFIFIFAIAAAITTINQVIILANITDLKADVQNLENDHDRMESKANSLRIADRDFRYRSRDFVAEARIKDYEYYQLNATLTLEEKRVYVNTIIAYIQQSINYRSKTSLIVIYRHFNKSTDDLMITKEIIAGYDYKITWEIWQSFLSLYGPPVYEINASETYGYLFSYADIQLKGPNERPRDLVTDKETFFEINETIEWGFLNITDYFLYSPVISLQDEINNKLIELEIIEAESLKIALVVPLITLGAVSLEIIANHFGDKKIKRQFKESKEVREIKNKVNSS